MPIAAALIGMGYWGPILARNIAAVPDIEIAALCDIDAAQLARWQTELRIGSGSTDPLDIIRRPDIDVVFLAVPLQFHHTLALAALEAGKDVFVEKPLAATCDEAAELVEIAARKRRVLMVDHVFAYTPAVRRIRELIADGTLGRVYYYDSVRINLGLFRDDSNVLWDLAVHDLSIIDYLFDEKPSAVAAVGQRHFGTYTENMAYMTCFFDSGMIAHMHVNWLAPVKVRQVLIGGAERTIAYDDLEADAKVKVYDRGVELSGDIDERRRLQIGYRMGDMWAPRLERYDALQAAIAHFADCVVHRTPPLTDGLAGLRTVRLLEAADRALRDDRSKFAVTL